MRCDPCNFILHPFPPFFFFSILSQHRVFSWLPLSSLLFFMLFCIFASTKFACSFAHLRPAPLSFFLSAYVVLEFDFSLFPFSLPCPAVSPSPFPSSLPVFSTPISPSLLFANHPGPAFFPHRMSFLSAYNVLFLVSLEFFWLSEWQWREREKGVLWEGRGEGRRAKWQRNQ